MLDITKNLIHDLPLIRLQLLAPLLGIAFIWLVKDASKARWFALIAAFATLIIGLVILTNFDAANNTFQFVEHASWIPTLNVSYHVGVDGISVLFLPLTGLLFLGAILSSWNSARIMPQLYYTLMLLLESVTLGTFCALDTILFFLFWELTLIPIYFLISLWGVGPFRRYAAVKYTLFMMASGIPLILAFVLMAFNVGHVLGGIPADLTFDYPTLMSAPASSELQIIIFFLLLFGFAAKVPVFPLHTWLPTLAMEGSASIAALVTGLKLGAYGMIRYLLPLAPEAARQYHWLLVGLGVVGVIYGALVALTQTNLRRMLAYSSISHVGLVVLGIASQNLQGIQGALFQLLNFSLVSGGLFLLCGFLHHRTGSTDTLNLGGVATAMPLLSAFFLLLGLASLGVPGTNGFPAEFLILLGTLKTHTGAGLVALAAMILSAAYFLGIFRKTFLGPATSSVVTEAVDLRPREFMLATVLGLLVLLLGLFPSLVLDVIRESTSAWVQNLSACE
jgi:NADH-quinone oxidoreductase subunit M